MLRSSTPICVLCEMRALLPGPARMAMQTRLAMQTRTLSLMHKKRPARMVLSKAVARPPPAMNSAGRRVRPRNTEGPFAALNQTEARIRGEIGPRSAAELKRSTRGKEGKGKEEKDKGFKALKMQRALQEIPYEVRQGVKKAIGERDRFEGFGLLEAVVESMGRALGGLEEVSPTAVQRLAIPELMGEGKRWRTRKERGEEMEQFLLAAETGSGKTLAYTLPIVDALKRAEMKEGEAEEAKEAEHGETKPNPLALEAPPLSTTQHSNAGRPRAIILVPTSELVDQVGTLVKSLSHTVKFRSAMISAAYSGVVIRNRVFAPAGIDILISTPHLLASIAESDPNVLSRVTHLVVDEADSLFDRSFAPLTSDIITRATPSLKQLILCSATIPLRLDTYLRKRFPEIRRLATPNLHAIPRRVQLTVVDTEKQPYQGNKDLACADMLYRLGKDSDDAPADAGKVKRMIVFVNEREKTVELANFLLSKGIDATALNRDLPARQQADLLAQFTDAGAPVPAPPVQEARRSGAPRRLLPGVKVLVTTDIASRGIDTAAVRHVVLYDVPHTTIDFIHRLGRTGRMGRRGRGVVLVGRHDRKDVVAEVKRGMFLGKALI
ncbi:ATP-dependent RNA helicase mrh4, mitochondrial [Trichodelitschia bisporula]|uniref:RNA helicase n=1 Tax=Trichodelitschia bisporula TaxID=703511 RepID=A0A6G1HYQ2_9PEZI|nr:ATP-dependent RNA helicase mrh4, mitochondrial [Trichodelitschia bisporula]